VRLDETKRREVCAILAVGGTRLMAASYVGCHVETIRRRALRDPEFAEQLRKSELSAEITFLKSIQAAVGDVKQWRAAAWALERLFPERYARRSPDSITIEQMTEIIKALAGIIVGEIPAKKLRQRVLERVAELLADRPRKVLKRPKP
jgi:hypothetical protein